MEADAYLMLGNAFHSLGDFRKAINYHNRHLSIVKEIGNKAAEASAYCNLGAAFRNLGDFKKSIDYNNLWLSIAKELGHKIVEGRAYGNLGNCYHSLGDFKKAIDYYKQGLNIAKEVRDKRGEAIGYSHIGRASLLFGDVQKAIDCHLRHLSIAKDLGDKAFEGYAYGNLSSAFARLGDFKKAIDYATQRLSIAREVGDKAREGRAYCNLGCAFYKLSDFQKAIDYFNLSLSIAKEVEDKPLEGLAYGNLGTAFCCLKDFQKAIDYQSLHLSIAKELGDSFTEGQAYNALGLSFECMGLLPEALENYQSSVKLLNSVRGCLQHEDDWKIGFRDECNTEYTGLWRVLLKQGKIVEALFAAEEGRAQALVDLMEFQYGLQASQSVPRGLEQKDVDLLCYTSSRTVFLGINENVIHFWVLSKGKPVCYRKKELGCYTNDGASTIQLLIQGAYKNIGVGDKVRCEDRSMGELRQGYSADGGSAKKLSPPLPSEENPLISLFSIVFEPIADLLQEKELIIVPDGPLWRAPFVAFMNSDSTYLCESFRMRVIPSLISLKLLADCPQEYHTRRGALLVGDPWVAEVTNSKGEKFLEQLPSAKKEVEMIGEILKEKPLIGKDATKDEVLKRLSSVGLVHIAAHGCIETGEIALTPEPKRPSKIPIEEEYVLTIKDVLSVELRAKLVVLSCCHSGRGKIKAEGVVGIARAFMGAGARSVLVSLWAIDDEATLEFMRHFYHYLVEGRSASESLNQAMKCLRESEKYSDVKYWAPFVLIGDDVTLEFGEKE